MNDNKDYDKEYYNDQYFKVREFKDLDNYVKEVISSLALALKSDMTTLKVLDVACGVGVYCKFIDLLGVKEVHGLDFSESAINQAKLNCPRGIFTTGDSKKMPYADNTFDLIINAHMVEHFTDREIMEFLNESLRVLNSGGKILIMTPNGWCPSRYLFPKTWFYDPSHINFCSPLKLAKLFHKAGFTNIKISQDLAKNNPYVSMDQRYVPPKGYFGLHKLDKLMPGIFDKVLHAANKFPMVLIRDVIYISAQKP